MARKKKASKGKNPANKLPRGLKPNPGPRTADDTVYHDQEPQSSDWVYRPGRGAQS